MMMWLSTCILYIYVVHYVLTLSLHYYDLHDVLDHQVAAMKRVDCGN